MKEELFRPTRKKFLLWSYDGHSTETLSGSRLLSDISRNQFTAVYIDPYVLNLKQAGLKTWSLQYWWLEADCARQHARKRPQLISPAFAEKIPVWIDRIKTEEKDTGQKLFGFIACRDVKWIPPVEDRKFADAWIALDFNSLPEPEIVTETQLARLLEPFLLCRENLYTEGFFSPLCMKGDGIMFPVQV
jgi:hypothetical protein